MMLRSQTRRDSGGPELPEDHDESTTTNSLMNGRNRQSVDQRLSPVWEESGTESGDTVDTVTGNVGDDQNNDYNDDNDNDNNKNTNNSFQFPFFDNEDTLDLSTNRSTSFSYNTHSDHNLMPETGTKNSYRDASTKNSDSHQQQAPTDPSTHDTMMMTMMISSALSPIAKSRDSDEHAIVVNGDGDVTADPVVESTVPDDGQHWENTAKALGEDDEKAMGQSSSHLVETNEGNPRVSKHLSSTARTAKAIDKRTNDDDLQSAKKQVGESSSRFIDEITNAAHRRRVEVSRSRDSLVAKEQEQLLSIAETKRIRSEEEEKAAAAAAAAAVETAERKHKDYRSKADRRSMGKVMDGKGFAGFGVPKVEKRPTTTPFSPLLGRRRKGKITVKSLQKTRSSLCGGLSMAERISSNTTSKTSSSTVPRRATISPTIGSDNERKPDHAGVGSLTKFKARPVPPTIGKGGHAGQAGVPKVPKRPITVPVSPCLGPKHRSRTVRKKHPSTKDVRSFNTSGLSIDQIQVGSMKSSTTPLAGASSGSESSLLLGLAMLDSPSADSEGDGATPPTVTQNDENQTPPPSRNMMGEQFQKAFEPRSTCRANKRAEYDAIRNRNIQKRLQEERKHIQGQIRVIHRELAVLRQDL